MANLNAKTVLSLLFALCIFPTSTSGTPTPQQAGTPRAEQRTNVEEAKALEEGLKASPDNLAAQERLINYYFEAMLTSKEPGLEEKREQHVFWLIEHHPESELAGSPEAAIQPVGFSGSTEGYERGKQLWLAQVQKNPDNITIVRNAAEFVSLWDRALGRELLENALLLAPGDPAASSALAQSYMQERMMARSPDEKAELAKKALAVHERALDNSSGEPRFDSLADLADEAYEAGNTAKAELYASELLELALQFKKDWNCGNALHKGNIILGRIALQHGDVSGAKKHLLAAGETPGSPQLNSFGPNMTLAKELLEKGERDAVLTYLQSCKSFWETGSSQLQDWIATVKAGGMPDFGGNLLY
jgi:hypothetical protein